MDFNESIEKELDNVLTLVDENEEEYKFEFLDALEHNGKKYLVVVPEDSLNEVVFLEVQEDVDGLELVCVFEDDYCEELFEIFKERNKNIFG